MITLDFTGLHEPQCKGVDKPGTEGSDFETVHDKASKKYYGEDFER